MMNFEILLFVCSVLSMQAIKCLAVKNRENVYGNNEESGIETEMIRPNVTSRHCMDKFSCDGNHTNSCHCDSLCEIMDDCCDRFKPEKLLTNSPAKYLFTCINTNNIRPRLHVDTDFGALFVAACPEDWDDDESKSLCENWTEVVQMSETYVDNEGIVFKNIFCAFCNRVLNHTYDLQSLKICSNVGIDEEDKYRVLNCSYFHENTASGDMMRLCPIPSYMTLECSMNASNEMSENCTNGNYELVYDSYGNLYRNIYCALCNDVVEKDISCEKYKVDVGLPYAFKTLFVNKESLETDIGNEDAKNATKVVDSTKDGIQIYVTIVALVISIISLIITVVVYACFPKLMNTTGKITFCLALSLLIAQILFLLSSEAKPIQWLCTSMAILVHYWFLAAFCWMNIIAYDIWMKFAHHIFDFGEKRKFCYYSLYAWLVPFIIVTIAVVFNFSENIGSFSPNYGDKVCGITSENATLLFFVIPLALFKVFDIVAFFCTVYHIAKTRRETRFARQENACSFLINLKLSLIMGLTWTFSFVAKFSDNEVLWYMFTIFNAIQGLYIFVFFVCNKRVLNMVRNALCSSKRMQANVKSNDTKSTSV